MRVIDVIVCGIFFSAITCRANADCGSDRLNRDQELICAHKEELDKSSLAERLYKKIRGELTGPQRDILDRNHINWITKRETDCTLQRDAFNGWGRDRIPDSDFQYQGCRNSVLDQQVLFYEGLICPDSMETGDKSDCDKLHAVLNH